MDDSQRDAVINALFLMAWKDGVVLAEEKSCLDRILGRLGVPRGDIMKMIDVRSQHPPGPDELERVLPDHESRSTAMKMLIAFTRWPLSREMLIAPFAMPKSATSAPEMKIFEPLMIQSSPSRTAFVRIARAGSEPPEGSVRPKKPRFSPRRVGNR